jgi:hypothetical protein
MAVVAAALIAGAQAPVRAANPAARTGERNMKHATGTFEVKVTPADVSSIGKEAGVGRMTIDKVWAGDMDGASKGEMLTSFTESTGAMAYVAIERFTGKVAGRSGSFYFMHNATMNRSDPKSGVMQIVVVLGSGTAELSGLTGTLTIIIDSAGKHSYMFDYELP